MAIIQQVFPIAFASNLTTASQSPAVEMPGVYTQTYLVIPTMTVGYSAASTPIYLRASADGTNFYPYANMEPTNNTLVAGINNFTVASSVSQKIVPLPAFGCRYVKLEISGTVTNPTAQTSGFQIICVSNQ